MGIVRSLARGWSASLPSACPHRVFSSLPGNGNAPGGATSSAHHHGQHPWYHYENERPEDAVPFSYDNKVAFTIKFWSMVSAAFSFPFFIVWWHSHKA